MEEISLSLSVGKICYLLVVLSGCGEKASYNSRLNFLTAIIVKELITHNQ